VTSVPQQTGHALPLTGERTIPGIPEENYWFRRHEAAYQAMLPHCVGALVLEAGCGEGYGADLIAAVARTVVALDYDITTARHVYRSYPRVVTVRANLAALPLAGASVDVVANMQVIEHLWDQRGFLAECARVLRPGGRLLLTTPNRITFSPGRDTPLNPFHTRELSPSELDELLTEAGFVVETLTGLHHGPRLRELEAAHGGSIIGAQVDVVVSGEAWPGGLLADVASVSTSDFVLSGYDIQASLDLVAVAVRP
jgi:SAM-dependent methyltransferase